VLRDHEVILCPTMATGPVPASRASRVLRRPTDDGKFHTNDMTGVWNLVSPCPALSVPVGFDTDGLPIGAQIVGRRWREDTVLQVGRALELAVGSFPHPAL
jgi:Asp-tRNA(Asn)/Glu-tRNA(Gln) amidotransferase A subunit family amidase